MRLLFVKPSLGWPRSNGHDVSCYFLMRALADLGADVSLLTADDTSSKAVEGIRLASCDRLWDKLPPGATPQYNLTWLQERFRSFWGVSPAHIESIRATVAARKIDVVIAYGLPALPYLAGADGAVRVWAMADEWVYHHLSLVRIADRSTWPHLRAAMIKGLYERCYRSLVDRAWAVSDTDQRAARWFAGMRVVDLLPNGVDENFYHPLTETETPSTAVFWGRLDFEPNIDALVWFCREIWPSVVAEVPAAKFTIMGYQPTPVVQQLQELPGVSLRANVDDLRPVVCQHALVVLPMVSGGGIKNKLLEGAAMGRPIVCTPRACMDLKSSGELPMAKVQTPTEWIKTIVSLWSDEPRRTDLGRRAREWVTEYYSWQAPARNALKAFQQSLDKRQPHGQPVASVRT